MSTLIVQNPNYPTLYNFLRNLPDIFCSQGEMLFDGRNEIKLISTDEVSLNVKSFQIPNIINKVVYGNFRKSKARRSFEYANVLLEKGIFTPAPVGYVEVTRGFLFDRSYYVSIQENFDGLMREFKTGKLEGREDILIQFAQFAADMHTKEVLHEDFSPGNILYKKDNGKYLFYLVDLNRMYFGAVSFDMGCYNFRRLWGSDEMIAFIASEYAKARNFDVDKCVKVTLSYHRDFWEKFTRRHKDKQPYISEI